jgi:hypothetical protein
MESSTPKKIRNSRTAGHNWERSCVNILKDIYPETVSSRSESKRRDDQKVDLMYTGIFNVQCKNVNTRVNYVEVLRSMPVEKGRINVIFEKKTKKSLNAGRFLEEGRYIHMDMNDFINLIRNYETLLNNNNSIITI